MFETIFGESEGGKGQLAATEIDEQKFLRAKRGLIGEGIDADTAEINLRKLAEVVVASTKAEPPVDGVAAADSPAQGYKRCDEIRGHGPESRSRTRA